MRRIIRNGEKWFEFAVWEMLVAVVAMGALGWGLGYLIDRITHQ